MKNNIFNNKQTLTKEQSKKAKFGAVFIVNDKEVFNPKGVGKPRRVVLLGKKNGSLIVAPIRRSSNKTLELSRFDGNRSVIIGKAVTIAKNKIYSKNGFKHTENDFLTPHEKYKLKKKLIKK